MKIALVKRRYSLKAGGSERYCVNLARKLRDSGHDVTVIGHKIDDELRDEVDFRPVAVNNLTSWTGNRSFAENCGRAAQDGRFDIVYGLGRAYGLDCVRVTERLQSHWLNVRYRHPAHHRLQTLNPRHRTLINLERTIYRDDHVRRIVTQSRLDRRLVVEKYGVPDEKIRTIYNGVDTATFHPGVRSRRAEIRNEFGLGEETPLLVFASMDFEGKGLRHILHAIANSRHDHAHLLVLGRGPEAKFRRVADGLGIAGRIIFAGRRSDIENCYGAGDLFLLPTAYEPFPNVNLEAMACGLPVMTTTTAGGADIIDEGQNGYLVADMQAVEQMTAVIDRHLGLSDEDRQRMAECCWNRARQMTVDENVRQTLEMFEEILVEKFRA